MKMRVPKNSTVAQLLSISGNLQLAVDSLEKTRYIPTIFPSFNRAIVIGGAPLRCIWTVHGPYGDGKSTFAVGLLKSFVDAGHLGVFFDSEHTANKEWFLRLGLDPTKYLFERPGYMEDMSDKIDTLIDKFNEQKEAGNIEPDKGLIIIIDSINKLTPKAEYNRFIKEGAEALDKALSRYRGLIIQSWLDHMTPIVGKSDVALICIAQEREVKGAKPWEPQFQVKGCQGMGFDSSVQIRVIRQRLWSESGKKKLLEGYKHKLYVLKNKVGYCNEEAVFITGNGKGNIPLGFDPAYEAFLEASEFRKLIRKDGSWYKWEDLNCQGQNAFIKALRDDPELLATLCDELNKEVIEKNNLG